MNPNTSDLKGQHALVTGAGRGIGAAIVDELASLGANITLVGRTVDILKRHAESVASDRGVRTHVAVADVTEEKQVKQAYASAKSALGAPSILVNNAGAAASAPFARTSLGDWQAMLAVNLTGVFLCSRQALPAMLEAGYGRIVTVASTAGLKGYSYVSPYCAAKHGAIGLTRALAMETARTGVTVNAVCPGYTDTDMVQSAVETILNKTGRNREQALSSLTAANPQRRLIDPSEVAETVAWLALPGSSAITGQSIAVAGGEVM